MNGLTHAAQDVLAERQRQVSAEGWTPEHDDEHKQGEMALAAACYAAHTATWEFIGHGLDSKGGPFRAYQSAQEFVGRMWPWAREWWKPKDERTNLVRAAALLLAEIERMDRATCNAGVTPAVTKHGVTMPAIARCSYCGRYSLDRKTLGEDRYQPVCECGEKHGWSGSFKKPGQDAKWSGKAPAGVKGL